MDLYLSLSVWLSICLHFCFSVGLSIYVSICLPFCLYAWLSVFIHLAVCWANLSKILQVSICSPSVCLPVYLKIRQLEHQKRHLFHKVSISNVLHLPCKAMGTSTNAANTWWFNCFDFQMCFVHRMHFFERPKVRRS